MVEVVFGEQTGGKERKEAGDNNSASRLQAPSLRGSVSLCQKEAIFANNLPHRKIAGNGESSPNAVAP